MDALEKEKRATGLEPAPGNDVQNQGRCGRGLTFFSSLIFSLLHISASFAFFLSSSLVLLQDIHSIPSLSFVAVRNRPGSVRVSASSLLRTDGIYTFCGDVFQCQADGAGNSRVSIRNMYAYLQGDK